MFIHTPHTCTLCPVFSLDPSVVGLVPPCTCWRKDTITRLCTSHTCVTWSAKRLFFFPFCISSFLSLVYKSLSTTDPRLPTTKLIYSNSHSGAAVLSAPMMLLCCSFASASFTSRNPSSLSLDRLHSNINIHCDPIRSLAPETIYEERPWIEVVPCLLTFFDRYCHLYILCLLCQIFLAADS